nr:MAG: glutamate racemase [Hyphomicrobiales bacterium]
MIASSEKPIGIFDSGIGGLTVMRALMAQLPDESFVYLGDTARLPYGTKSPDTVTRYAVQCANAVGAHDVKILVVACNTASAVAMDALHAALGDTPVLGVIEPGAEAAVAAAPGGKIAVIATESTVNGGAYVRAIKARNPNASIFQKPCPLFVALAEEGLTEGDIPERIARHYLEPLLAAAGGLECLVLGCTHYPALANIIAHVAGRNIALVDSAETTARAVNRLLSERNIRRQSAPTPPRFLATDAPARFARVGERFLGKKINESDVALVDL